METIMSATIVALKAEEANCHAILNIIFPNTDGPTLLTPKDRDMINFMFGKLNEIERKIAIETERLERPFYKKLFRK